MFDFGTTPAAYAGCCHPASLSLCDGAQHRKRNRAPRLMARLALAQASA